jgi:hypothetical protein
MLFHLVFYYCIFIVTLLLYFVVLFYLVFYYCCVILSLL